MDILNMLQNMLKMAEKMSEIDEDIRVPLTKNHFVVGTYVYDISPFHTAYNALSGGAVVIDDDKRFYMAIVDDNELHIVSEDNPPKVTSFKPVGMTGGDNKFFITNETFDKLYKSVSE